MKNRTVKRKSLTDQIKSILIDRIVDGTLCSGDRLKELQIANEFGTSQAPVREAIRSLQALGYVEHKPHIGAIVKTFTKKEIEEAYQIREALEGHCLILANFELDSLTEQLELQYANMQVALEKQDVKLFTMADNNFHKAIIKCSHNERMLEMWESLKMPFQVVTTLAETVIPLEELVALHGPIVATLKQKKREGSARYLARHYKRIGAYWKKHN